MSQPPLSARQRLTAAGVVHRFVGDQLQVRVLQPGWSAPWWPAVAHGDRVIPLPREMAAMPEIAAAVAAWAGNGGTEQSCHVVPREAPSAASQEVARVAAWKQRNREKVRDQKRRARARKKAA